MIYLKCVVIIGVLTAMVGCSDADTAVPKESQESDREKPTDTGGPDLEVPGSGSATTVEPTDTSIDTSMGEKVTTTTVEPDSESESEDTRADADSLTMGMDTATQLNDNDTAGWTSDSQTAEGMFDGGDAADGDDIDLGISTDPVTLLVVFDKSGSMSSTGTAIPSGSPLATP